MKILQTFLIFSVLIVALITITITSQKQANNSCKIGVVNAKHLRRGNAPFGSADLSAEPMQGRDKIIDH